MPFKISNHIVSGHTGWLVDALIPKSAADKMCEFEKPPRSLKTIAPRISIQKLTPANRHLSPGEHAKIVRAIPRWTDARQLVQAVTQHIDAELNRTRSTQQQAHTASLILLGERHKNKACLLVELAVLAYVTETAGAPLLLIEGTDADVRAKVLPVAREALRQLGEAAALPDNQRDRKVNELFGWNTENLVMASAVALHLGGDIGGFDDRHHDGNMQEREAGMSRAIEAFLAKEQERGRPVVVMCGSTHLPVLHQGVSASTPVASIASVSSSLLDASKTRLRQGQAQQAPGILTFRNIGFGKDRGIDYASFLRDIRITLA